MHLVDNGSNGSDFLPVFAGQIFWWNTIQTTGTLYKILRLFLVLMLSHSKRVKLVSLTNWDHSVTVQIMLLCFIFDYSVTVNKSLLNNIHGGKFVFLERGLSGKIIRRER